MMYKKILEFLSIFRPYFFSIIDRYILADFVKSVIGSMTLFIVIILFSLLVNDVPYFINQMEAGDKSITMDKIFTMYANQIPHKALWVSPLAFLFSTIYTLGTFYKNNEAVAYIGAGIHLIRITFVILLLSFVYSLLLIPFTDLVVVPTFDRAETLSREMKHKTIGDITANLETYGQDNYHYFIQKYDPKTKTMHYPTIYKDRVIQGKELDYNKKAFFIEFFDEGEKKQKQKSKDKKIKEESNLDPSGIQKTVESLLPYIQKEIEKQKKGIEEAKEMLRKKIPITLGPIKKSSLNNKLAYGKGIHKNKEVTYESIKDDFPENELKHPPKTPNPESNLGVNSELSRFFSLITEPNTQLSPVPKEDEFIDLEEKHLKVKTKEYQLLDMNKLVEQSFRTIDKNKIIDPGATKKANQKGFNVLSSETTDKGSLEETTNKKENEEVEKDYRDLYRISSLPTNRYRAISSYSYNKHDSRYVNKNLKVKKERPIYQEKVKTELIRKLDSSTPRPLEATDEINLLDNPDFKPESSIDALVREQKLITQTIPIEKFNIPKLKYHIIPYAPYFELRIDAKKAVWNKSIKKWVAYDCEIRHWDIEKGLIRLKRYDKYILNGVKDKPSAFLIKHKPIDQLTLKEGNDLIASLKNARKKWREPQIKLYANKFAFQLSTFLIVMVGVSLGQFHSRKLIFVNSLYRAFLIFLLYFVLFQLGVSLAIIFESFPIFLAPWVGNIIFFIFGIYMLKKAKT